MLMASQASLAQSESFDLGLTGSARLGYWREDKSFDGNTDFLTGSFWLNLRPSEIAGFKTYAEAYAVGQDLSRSNQGALVLREAFVERTWGDLDLKIGRQIVVWGRADKVNPTDNFSALNMTRLFTDSEDQRLGGFAVNAVYNFDRTKLIAIWAREWIEPVYPIAPQAGVRLIQQTPSETAGQFGLKIDQSGGEVDGSISYYDGYSKAPDLQYLGSSTAGVDVALKFNKIRTWGADFATNIGEYGIRGEVAYTQTSDSDGNNAFKQNPFLFAVLGADRTLFENFNLNIQGLYRHIDQFSELGSTGNSALDTLARAQSVNTQQQTRDQAGVSVRPQFKMLNDTLEFEVALVSWFYKGDNLVRPKVTYQWTDNTRLIVGGEIYGGPDDSFFGRLKDSNSVFTEFRYLF